MRQIAIAFSVLSLACGATPGTGSGTGEPVHDTPVMQPAPQDKSSPLAGEAMAGVEHAGLQNLLKSHWDWTMKQSPVWATTLGDHRFDDRLSLNSQEDIDAARLATRKFLQRAQAVPRDEMSTTDRITLDLFIGELESSISTEVCELHKWSVSAFGTPVGEFNTLPERHKIETALDGGNLLARYHKIPTSVDHTIANLRAGLDGGLVANAESVRRAIEMVDRQLEKPIAGWALLEPVRDMSRYKSWTDSEKAELQTALEAQVKTEIKPAFERYRAVLAEILPEARKGTTIGVGALPNGEACYQARIHNYIALERTAKQLHELGLSEIKRINGEMKVLGKKLFGTSNLARIIKRLRTDKKLYFDNPGDIVKAAGDALAAAKAEIPGYFGILPRADCVVVEIPDYEAPYTTVAYYRQPHFDGSKPGEYFINT